MILYQSIVTIFLFAILINLLNNLRLLKHLPAKKKSFKNPPLVSVLIPARNEGKNIERCIKSLVNQDYPNVEIIVYDDNSEDDTLVKLKRLQSKYPRLKVYSGKPLPEGWTGKNFACYTLSQYAQGEWLLFTDSDTLHRQGSISSSIIVATDKKAELLSIMPDIVIKTFAEKLFMPLVQFALLSFLPLGLINVVKEPRAVIAIGPFMLLNAEFYRKIGGHKVIKDKIVDDLCLAQEVKKNGGKVVFFDGSDKVSVRFYDNIIDLWNGFSKNSFGAFENSPLILLSFLTFNFCLYILPYFLFLSGILRLQIYLFPSMQILLITAQRFFLSLRFRTKPLLIFLHPFSMILGFLIALNSMRLALLGRAVVWKERVYNQK